MNQQTKHFLGWCLFDFSGSFLMINGGLYFPQWLVVDHSASDFIFNMTTIIVSILLILTGAYLGSLADRNRNDVSALITVSIVMFASTLALHFISYAVPFNLRANLGLICYGVLLFSYQIGSIVYNGMLTDIRSTNHHVSNSAWGYSAGWLGGIVGILLVAPFASGWFKVPYVSGRSATFLPTAVLFFILMGISLFLLRNYKRNPGEIKKSPIVASIITRRMMIFLVCFLLFSDAVLTFQNNFSILLDSLWTVDDTTKALFFILLLVTAAGGALLSIYLSKYFSMSALLRATLISWVAMFIALSLVQTRITLYCLLGFVGLLYGLLWNLSRSIFLSLFPAEARGFYFGLYSSFERFSSVIGPLLWIGALSIIPNNRPAGYQLALIAMSVLTGASLLVSFLSTSRLTPTKNPGKAI